MNQTRSPARAYRLWEALALGLITLLAAALRFTQLADVPPGLHYDEGFKGVMARTLLQGGPPQLFFASNMGEEPLAIYLVAASLDLVGQEPWAIRLPSALIGTLTVPLAWWLGRELWRLARCGRSFPGQRAEEQTAAASSQGQVHEGGPGQQEALVGLGAAAVLAILYWHLTYSRVGIEPILVPFFAALAFAALAHGLHSVYRGKPNSLSFALAGLAVGGSLYTYKAGYLVPLLALLYLVYTAIVERGFLRRQGRGLLLMALVALLVALPLGLYFATHPADFLHRPASVAVLGVTPETPPQGQGATMSPWQALAGNLPRVLGMFFVQGDDSPRNNLPGRPALDPFLALLFLLGLGRAVANFRRPALALLPIWLITMTVPTLITEYAPHFGRAIGATPAVAILCSLGGLTLWEGASRFGRRWLKAATALLLGLGLVFSSISTARAYFQTWGRGPDVFYAYDEGLVQIAQYANSLPAGEAVYLTPTSRDHYTLQFLVQRPLSSFDGRAGLVLPPPRQAATVIVLLREDEATLPALQKARADGNIIWTLADRYGRAYAMAYHLPATTEGETSLPLPNVRVGATIGDSVRLLGYSLDVDEFRPGDTFYLTLYWQALASLDEDYTVFTHLLGEHNPATNGPLWAGHDGQPDGGQYPTTSWQPGEVILDVHPLMIPADAPPGEYQFEAGLYLLETMTRLSASDAAGNPLAADAVILGTIEVQGTE